MSSNQPRADDVVLSGTSRVPPDAVVLGGLEGVTRRLKASNEEVRIAALRDALKYGQEGLELVVRIIQTETGAFQHAAWNLLWMMAIGEGKQELLDYLPKFTFDVITVNATGNTVSRQTSTAYFFSEDLTSNVRLEMVAIPGGTFVIGSPDTEAGHYSEESPQHSVSVKPFFIGKYPVTQAQWKAVAALPQVNQFLNTDPSYFKEANRPVERVSWHDAVEFCGRLSRKTGRNYRLPSEAEWEYACRAGTLTPFHFGETMTTDFANYDGNYTYSSGPKGTYRKETTPVGSFQIANAFGLYDMHGNVWEWCADSWHDNYEGAPTDGSVWQEENDSQYRLLRGGSWLSNSWNCRSAYRLNDAPGFRNYDIGFRVACSAALTL